MSTPEPVTARLDVNAIRGDFPILRQRVHDLPLVYLDNAATTQKPTAVVDAVRRFYTEQNANVHRGVHQLSERATAAFEGAREAIRRSIGAASAREVVFVRGTTEAINLVAQSFVRPRVSEGDEIVVTHMEHHSNIVPWQMVCQQTGATLRVIPMDDRGALVPDAVEAMIGERTRFVSVSHVSNALGTINDVRRIIAVARRSGAPVLLDAAQAVPHLGVDVQELGCDFLAFSGHKVYGPTGIGVLHGKEEHLEAMPPYQGGGDMIASVTFEATTYNELPFKFEAGTPNVAGAVGLGAALEYLHGLGLPAVAAHEAELVAAASRALEVIPGVRLIGTAPRRAAVVSFVLDGVHAHDVGTVVDGRGVAIRTGHHCAEPAMRHFGVAASARASFAAYNTLEEVEALAAGVEEARRLLGT